MGASQQWNANVKKSYPKHLRYPGSAILLFIFIRNSRAEGWLPQAHTANHRQRYQVKQSLDLASFYHTTDFQILVIQVQDVSHVYVPPISCLFNIFFKSVHFFFCLNILKGHLRSELLIYTTQNNLKMYSAKSKNQTKKATYGKILTYL